MWLPKERKFLPRGDLRCQPRLVYHTADWKKFANTNTNFPPVAVRPPSADGLVYEFKGKLHHMDETTLESVPALLQSIFVPTVSK